MKPAVVILCILLWPVALIAEPVSDKQNVKTVVALSMEYPPFLSPALPGNGSSYELLNTLLQSVCCWNIKAEFLPPSRLINYTRHSDDWLFSFMPIPETRQHVTAVKIRDDYIHSGFFRLRKDEPFVWKNLQQYVGSRVVLVRSLTEDNTEQKLVSAGMTVITVNHIRQGLHMLATGRADFVQGLEETGYYFAREENLDENSLQFTDPPAAVYPLTLYVNSRHPDAEQFIRDVKQALDHYSAAP